MQQQLAIYNLSGVLLADWSTRVQSCKVRSGAHGYESCEATLNLPFYEAFNYYQQLGPLVLRVSWGSYRIWEGRLEDPTQFANTASGLKITAFGGWVAFNDVLYTALWSDSKTDQWRVITDTDTAGSVSQRFETNLTNQIYMTARKGESFNLNVLGMIGYVTPHLGSRQITGISFDLDFKAPNANWIFRLDRRTSVWGFTASDIALPGTGAVILQSFNMTLTPTDNLTFGLYFNAAAAVFAGETGDCYFKVTNIRLVTSVVNRVNTALTVARAAGVNVTATVGSTAGMFVGQKIVMNSAGNPSETVVILSIGGATTFNATFVNAYVIGHAVQAHQIYPDEIMKACVLAVDTINPTQIDGDVSLIQSQVNDLDQAIYEDAYPTDIINQLIAKSDNQIPPRQWVALMYDDQRLVVRPRGTGRAWFTDVTSLEVVRTLTQLYNSIYGVYKDVAGKRNLRTTANADANSIAKFQITRQQAIKVDTTSVTQAQQSRDSVLANKLDPIPRANIKLDRVFDSAGNPFPLFYIRADDTLTIRNLPPVLSVGTYDKLRTLVITRVDYDVIADTITLELEIPMPDLNVQLAKALKVSI